MVGDTGDGPSGGAGGDNNAVLRALSSGAGADRAGRLHLALVDAEAVAQAGRGGPRRHRHAPWSVSKPSGDGQSVSISGRVRTLTWTACSPSMMPVRRGSR